MARVSARDSLGDLWPAKLNVIQDSPGLVSLALEDALNCVIWGDAIPVLGKLQPGIADCVFFDPPYHLQLSGRQLRRWGSRTMVDGVTSTWDQFDSFEDYDYFIERALEGVRRVMKPTGTMWAIGTYHSIFRIGRIMQDLGFWLLNDVTWIKTNPMPNWLGVRFTNATETLIWASRSKDARGYTFDREAAKRFGVGQVGAGVWVLPLCTGSERLRSNGKSAHPTQKPCQLLKRVILTSTMPGDLVLDPMAGVGTTGFVARAFDRDFLMIERDGGYVESMCERFAVSQTENVKRELDSSRVRSYLHLDEPNDLVGVCAADAKSEGLRV